MRKYDPKRYGADCDNCPLSGRPCVPPQFEDGHVIVGEAPGAVEVKQGRPFVGPSGKLLTKALEAVGARREFLHITNTVLCYAPQVPPAAIEACKPRLLREIEGRRVLVLGNVAAEVICPTTPRGQWSPDKRALFTWHPAYVLRNPNAATDFCFAIRKFFIGPYDIRLEEARIIELTKEADPIWLETELANYDYVALDIETDQMNWERDKILCVSIAVSPERAYVIGPDLIYSKFGRHLFNWLFTHPHAPVVVGHNIKFDLRFLVSQLGIDIHRTPMDTMLAHYTLFETGRHGLKELAIRYFDVEDYEEKYIKPYIGKDKRYSAVPYELLAKYCAYDTIMTLRLWYRLSEDLKQEGLYNRPFLYPIRYAYRTIMEMELHGLLVSWEEVEATIKEANEECARLQKEMESLCGREFNPNSWIQVSNIMYKHFHMPHVRLQDGSIGKTNRETRTLIAQQLDPESDAARWLDLLDQVKSIRKLVSSYLTPLIKLRKTYRSDRVHPTYLLHGTVHGRLSARNPPIQTIPRSTTGAGWGEKVKKLFIAPPGYVIMVADYSQAEMRVAAAMSKDPFLLNVYREGRDLHTETTIAVYGENFTKEQRGYCKSANFALLYGGSPKSFIVSPGMDAAKTSETLKRYKELMGGLFEWRTEQYKSLLRNGYVSTPTGRQRRFPLVTRQNEEDARKAAVNSPVAGMASDLTLISLVKISERIKDESLPAHLLTTVHDSIILEVEDRLEAIEEVAAVVKRAMVETGEEYFPELPWEVDIEIGPSWGETHPL